MDSNVLLLAHTKAVQQYYIEEDTIKNVLDDKDNLMKIDIVSLGNTC